MMNRCKIKYLILNMAILLLCLLSMNFFYFNFGESPIVKFLLAIVVLLTLPVKIESTNKIFCFTIVFIFFLYKFFRLINVGLFMDLLIIFPVVLLSDSVKINSLNFITKSFAIIIGVSLVAWFLYFLGIVQTHSIMEIRGYTLEVCPFFLKSVSRVSLFPRFQGLFMEPGQLGMICAFLIYANNYNFRSKYLIVILLSLVFSFSLAAYLLFLVGFFFHIFSLNNTKKVIIYTVFFIVLFAILFVLLSRYEDTFVYQLIIKRLINNSGGDFVNSNRYQQYFLSFYNNKMSDFWTMLFGMGLEVNVTDFPNNSGAKIFFIRLGYIGALLLLLAYYSIQREYKSKACFLFLVLYVVAFVQRPYAEWYVEWILFILAMPVLKGYSSKMIDDSKTLDACI